MADGSALNLLRLPSLRLNPNTRPFERYRLFAIAVYGVVKRLAVVGEDSDLIAGAADRDIELFSIDEFG